MMAATAVFQDELYNALRGSSFDALDLPSPVSAARRRTVSAEDGGGGGENSFYPNPSTVVDDEGDCDEQRFATLRGPEARAGRAILTPALPVELDYCPPSPSVREYEKMLAATAAFNVSFYSCICILGCRLLSVFIFPYLFYTFTLSGAGNAARAGIFRSAQSGARRECGAERQPPAGIEQPRAVWRSVAAACAARVAALRAATAATGGAATAPAGECVWRNKHSSSSSSSRQRRGGSSGQGGRACGVSGCCVEGLGPAPQSCEKRTRGQ
jgi:hypothetical protein